MNQTKEIECTAEDGKRLDWLQANRHSIEFDREEGLFEVWENPTTLNNRLGRGTTLREAIDAARDKYTAL